MRRDFICAFSSPKPYARSGKLPKYPRSDSLIRGILITNPHHMALTRGSIAKQG